MSRTIKPNAYTAFDTLERRIARHIAQRERARMLDAYIASTYTTDASSTRIYPTPLVYDGLRGRLR